MYTISRRQFLSSASLALSGFAPPLAKAALARQIILQSRVLEVNGRAAKVFGMTVDGKANGLTTTYGEIFSAEVRNDLAEASLIHWHGLTPPVAMDGVPMLSGPTINPGETRLFSFDNQRTGTHWMHSHVGLQEQKLLAAPLIVKENGASLNDEQEHVVMLHDFTFREPEEILQELKAGGGLHAGHNMGKMAMPGMLGDIAYDAMLANDRTFDDPEIVQSEKSGRFRLRIINGSAATNIWIDLGALPGQLVAVDGNGVFPLRASRFPLAIAQRADIQLSLPPGSGAWPILFQAEGTLQQSAIILRAGGSAITKVGIAETPVDAIDLEQELNLRSIAERPDNPVSRTEIVTIGGGGSDYSWNLNGKSAMHDVLFNVREGERYEVVFNNLTSMAHPMHLHGHYFKVVAIDGVRLDGALRDTIHVPPGSTVAIQFDADNPGTWAFHCHHLYHMNAGMMAAISYSSAA